MIFKQRKICKDITIKIDGQTIQEVQHTKFLGVLLDQKLSWKNHIQYISAKVSKSIGILCKARKILGKQYHV